MFAGSLKPSVPSGFAGAASRLLDLHVARRHGRKESIDWQVRNVGLHESNVWAPVAGANHQFVSFNIPDLVIGTCNMTTESQLPPGSPPSRMRWWHCCARWSTSTAAATQAGHRCGRRGGAALHGRAQHSRLKHPPAGPWRLPARRRPGDGPQGNAGGNIVLMAIATRYSRRRSVAPAIHHS